MAQAVGVVTSIETLFAPLGAFFSGLSTAAADAFEVSVRVGTGENGLGRAGGPKTRSHGLRRRRQAEGSGCGRRRASADGLSDHQCPPEEHRGVAHHEYRRSDNQRRDRQNPDEQKPTGGFGLSLAPSGAL